MKDNSAINDNTLFDKFKEGNLLAFNSIFEKYYASLVVFAKKYLSDLDLSKDIVQDYFVKLYERKDDIEIKSSFKSYIYLSVRNACLNYLEKKEIQNRHHKNIQYSTSELTEETTEKIEETELQYEIYKQISKLPEQCERIFKMSRMDGKRNQDIADELKISKRTVETQISKALKILRENLKNSLLLTGIWLLQITSKIFQL